jgi:uncharacterized protein YbbC (DUF1343 family)
MKMFEVKLGIDEFLKNASKFKGKNIALLTNASGINVDLKNDLDLLNEYGLNVVKIFGPEHGIWGAVADGESVSNAVEPRYHIPIFSLYGETQRPTEEMLKDVEVVIYDIQDVGLRFYTYIYTLAYMMEECGKRGIKVVVLDRPNPLSGKVEGPLIENELESFVGGYGLALRYGLTIGELSVYFNERYHMNVELEVIKMEGWKRWMYFDDTNLLWPTPSPNLPSLEHTLLYVGMCLLEGVNLSVGRGTVHPFKYIGAPWINSEELKKEMEKVPHPGVTFRERDFIPLTSKYKNELCHGLEFFVLDKKEIKSLRLALELISLLKKLYPDRFEWDISYHNAQGRYHFDFLMGSAKYRKWIEEGKDVKDMFATWEEDSRAFMELSKKFYLYE